MPSDVIALPETFDKSSLEDKPKKNTQENANKRKRVCKYCRKYLCMCILLNGVGYSIVCQVLNK